MTNASAIADEVAEIYRLHKVTRVELAGHADFTEAEDVELSARRVRAVQSLLIQRGVPPEIIVVRFWGSARPVVPPVLLTPEPQNRRVEISFY